MATFLATGRSVALAISIFVLWFTGGAIEGQRVGGDEMSPSSVTKRSAIDLASMAPRSSTLETRQSTCIVEGVNCNQVVVGELTDQDCPLHDGTFIDFWEFPAPAGLDIVVDLESLEFDTYLFLLDPESNVEAVDDDGGEGLNSHLALTLNEAGSWSLGANGFGPLDLGTYSLSLQCLNLVFMDGFESGDLLAWSNSFP